MNKKLKEIEQHIKNRRFSYTISFMNYIKSTRILSIPFPNFITYNLKQDDGDVEKLNSTQVYLKNHCHQNFIVLWDKDFEHDENDSFKFIEFPAQVNVEQLNECIKSDISFRSVLPMTIHYLSSVSFIRIKKASYELTAKVGLFIQADPKERNRRNIVFINPEEGGDPEDLDVIMFSSIDECR